MKGRNVMNIREKIGKELLFFDGGMGTMLQAAGMQPGEIPETWCFLRPDEIKKIHKQYLHAGANIIETNSFGANGLKFSHDVYTPYDAMKKSVELARNSIDEFLEENNTDDKRRFVAASIGPCGHLLEPLGDISFDRAYDSFKEMAVAADDGGADILLIETMTDSYELKAAILACKENTTLPIIASFMLDESSKLLTGGNIYSLVPMLEGLGVDAVGINCGFGPKQIIEFMKVLKEETSLPIMINSNAGMPKIDTYGNTYYDLSVNQFAEYATQFIDLGASMVGGCCGTTPEHIQALREISKDKSIVLRKVKSSTVVTSYASAVEINHDFKVIGERINPTGNKPLKAAIQEKNLEFVSSLAIDQVSSGAHIIDVNAGMPGVNEVDLLESFIKSVQKVCPAPLMIDSSNTDALEKACRYYNGKPFINSVSGKESSLEKVLPIAKKYGGVLIALTLDDTGIPKTAEDRVAVAKKIIDRAASYGIDKNDIVVDPLTLTISSDPEAANVTLKAIELLSKENIKTSVGLSNISFGLPSRDTINATFLAQCLQAGLNTAIVNPSSKTLMNTYHSYRALRGFDESAQEYINKVTNIEISDTSSNNDENLNLTTFIEKGLKEDSIKETSELIKSKEALDIVNEFIIPALDKVGETYEKGISFLPQLLMSAEAAQGAFSVLQDKLKTNEQSETFKATVVVATVKGDIHDIGKNIAKVLLENYGYRVIDLGKDVDPSLIVETAIKEKADMVGLSALMTTTLPSMEDTISLIRENNLPCQVLVGGAVLTKSLAERIGADFFCKDAMSTVKFAEQLCKQ